MDYPPLPSKTLTWKTVKDLTKPDNTWIIEHFHRYADMGIATFPIIDGPKVPPKGSHGHLEATTDLGAFLKLLDRANGQHVGLAARMGDRIEGGYLVCLDVDEKNGKSGSRTLKSRRFNPPMTLTAATRSGGRHYVYTAPYPVRTQPNWLGGNSGLDIKGTGGWITVEPTTGYEWDDCLCLESIAAAPDWLLQRSLKGSKKKYERKDVLHSESVPCPVHDDDRSLWVVKYKDGTHFFRCFAGCNDHKVGAALGLAVTW